MFRLSACLLVPAFSVESLSTEYFEGYSLIQLEAKSPQARALRFAPEFQRSPHFVKKLNKSDTDKEDLESLTVAERAAKVKGVNSRFRSAILCGLNAEEYIMDAEYIREHGAPPDEPLSDPEIGHRKKNSTRLKLVEGTKNAGNGFGKYVGHIVASTTLIFLMCGDDIIWLLPFVSCSGREGNKFAVFYTLCMLLLWLIAFLLYLILREVEEEYPYVPVQKISELCSTVLLAGLTVKFFFEWYHEHDELCEEEVKEVAGSMKGELKEDPTEKVAEDASSHLQVKGKMDRMAELKKAENKKSALKKKLSFNNLFLVATAGNFDNVGVYVPIMLSGVMRPDVLLIGDLIAAILITLITIALSRFKFLVDLFTCIPLWVIVGVMTVLMGVDTVLTFNGKDSIMDAISRNE